jgi:CIC family chloride channel protein
MIALVVLKIVATSVTLGAGASGGVFTPALFIGAMAGGAFGQGVNILFPTLTAEPGAYALVGMAAVFAGAAHAPITGIVILFEMTDNYQIILPLMFSVVVSYLIAARILHDSVYSMKLRRRGALTAPRSSMSVLDLLLVTDVMVEEFETVTPDMSLEELAKLAQSRRTRSWPVVGSEDELRGIVTETDLERAMMTGLDGVGAPELCVRDVMTTAVTTCVPGDTLRKAFGRFTEKDVQQIPVLDQEDESTVVGVIRRHDMLWAYRKLMDEHQELMDKASVLVRDPREDAVQIEVQVGAQDRSIANRSVRDIRVPPHALIVLVRRGERSFIPKGHSRIEAGDVLVLLTTRRHEAELRAWTSAWRRPNGGVGVLT